MKEESNIPVPAGAGADWQEAIAAFALEQMNRSADSRLLYHRYSLAARTAEYASELCEAEKSDPQQSLAALAAAWLHLLGYGTDYAQAQTRSRMLVRKYLQDIDLDVDLIDRVEACLEALERGARPEDKAVRIFLDAWQGARYGNEYSNEQPLLRLEQELMQQKPLSDAAWTQLQLQELLRVKYYTATGKRKFEGMLSQNILNQKKLVDRNRHKVYVDKDSVVNLKKYGSIERKVPTSGVQTFFRTNYRNHINLSAIADNKANIMISVNAILISVLISIISYKNITETNPMVLMPVVIFLVTGLSSLIFAVLSARPKVTSINGVNVSPEEARRNVVFFGSFVRMDLEKYEEAVDAVFRDSELLYGNMTRDLYYLGKVLDKKYRYLTVSYNIFMIGFVATVLTFLIALLT